MEFTIYAVLCLEIRIKITQLGTKLGICYFEMPQLCCRNITVVKNGSYNNRQQSL